MPKKYYVTTPIYYVNDKPHLGHVYTTVAADTLARYQRIEGKEAFFLTGTDEHGQKAEQAAKARGEDIQAHVDFHSAIFQNLWKVMNVSNDDFIRTTDKRHTDVVQEILQKLYDKGEIYADSYEGWYCVPDERFWMEKDLVDGNCPDCGRKVEKIEEKNYFFRMGNYQEWLVDHIKSNDDFILPKSRRNEVLGFLDKKLDDLCVSRPKARLSWGVELPFDKEYVAYVWFDALLNYVSAPGIRSDEKAFADIWPADIHLIGKDILTTHSVYWITMLKALELPLPKKIFAHGWWTVEGEKMSKSTGNVVDPLKIVDSVGLDPFRYFLMKEIPFGLDGDFSLDSLISRINVDLANNFGNLVSRSLKMVSKFRGSVLPKPKGGSALKELQASAETAMANYAKHLSVPAFHKALDEVISLCDTTNSFIVKGEPWNLAKDESKTDELDDLLYGIVEAIRYLGRMLYPVMPDTAEKLLAQLGFKKGEYGTDAWGYTPAGAVISEGEQLFPRIDEKQIEKIRAEILPPAKPGIKKDSNGMITFDDFQNLELKTGIILEAEAIPKSKKLVKVQVDLGSEKRQVVAGIAEHYSVEELIGKSVIVVANLKPAKLMGVESQGMLLAANNEGTLSLITTSGDVKGGMKVS